MAYWPLVLIVSFITVTTVTATTKVTCYDKSNYGGGPVVLDDLENYSYYYFTVFDNKLSSFKLDRGSCVVMDIDNPPSGGLQAFWSDSSISNVGSEWNDKISSVMQCGSSTRDIQCPSGTFVKRIEWDDGNSLRNGIRLYCSEPRSKTPSATLYTHPGIDFPGSRGECTGIRGIAYTRDNTREADVNLQPVCRPGQSNGNTIICQDNEAVAGMSVTIERYTNQIKSSTLYCEDVGDIERICEAHDVRSVLFVCDATEAVGDLRCERSKKVGMATKTSMSESHSNEYKFYTEFGFELGASGYGLSANFRSTIGESNTTGYNWAQSQETTWEEETTLTVEIVAPPGCTTTVSEIVGECSFMAVRPNIFYRNDTCINGVSVITPVTIPSDFVGKAFTSPVPRILLDSPTEYQFVPYSQTRNLISDEEFFKSSIVKLSEEVNENVKEKIA